MAISYGRNDYSGLCMTMCGIWMRKKLTILSMNVSNANIQDITWVKALFSKTLVIFHGVILASIAIVMFIAR